MGLGWVVSPSPKLEREIEVVGELKGVFNDLHVAVAVYAEEFES
jgi:hypothetical protein